MKELIKLSLACLMFAAVCSIAVPSSADETSIEEDLKLLDATKPTLRVCLSINECSVFLNLRQETFAKIEALPAGPRQQKLGAQYALIVRRLAANYVAVAIEARCATVTSLFAQIAQERHNPSGVVDLNLLHELGDDITAVRTEFKTEFGRALICR